MRFDSQEVEQAFELYRELALKGVISGDKANTYKVNEAIYTLTNQFVDKLDADCITVGHEVHLIPRTKLSPFHISNEYIKRQFLGSKSSNSDIYLMYLCSIVLIGSFYNSYQSTEPTIEFMTYEVWVQQVNDRIESLKRHDQEQLEKLEKEYSYRWSAIIEKWETLDELKESASRQTGRTMSRLSFIDTVRRFLQEYDLVEFIGQNEVSLTEKTKVIVGRYFMEREFNRGILEFLYGFEEQEDTHASY
ncbi:DUF6063 family protein [Ureibacillus manganicus]|uniref:Non-ribosomal peptide synthetase module n=1 Tax=Ureibacillus manganicus DSM 26584 TaxID=1384049 RepID=A0A0A3I2A8_9BACL|nr:DUF6063 family protein [Ureibacillus manganicus]KGR78961.1 hypothetical protein CD29_08015 [Ureibacillus manganicus DSM 26584]